MKAHTGSAGGLPGQHGGRRASAGLRHANIACRNLRKLTVSPWCDVESIAAPVSRHVVLSRKPHPMKLCGPRSGPDDFAATLRETLAMTRDSFVEPIFRDTNPLNGGMRERVAEASGIVRGLIDEGNG